MEEEDNSAVCSPEKLMTASEFYSLFENAVHSAALKYGLAGHFVETAVKNAILKKPQLQL